MELRKVGKGLIQLVLIAAAGIVLLAAYAFFTERRAENKAKEFCGRMKVGSATDALVDAAIASGADERQTRWIRPIAGPSWLAATFTGLTPLSRHICSITVDNGKVVTASYSYLD
jgi:hypothetical protein